MILIFKFNKAPEYFIFNFFNPKTFKLLSFSPDASVGISALLRLLFIKFKFVIFDTVFRESCK